MRARIISFFMAIYLFLICLPYGNQSKKIEFSYELQGGKTEYTVGDVLTIKCTAKNVGKPFTFDLFKPETSPYISMEFFTTKDNGERCNILRPPEGYQPPPGIEVYDDPIYDKTILIKKNQTWEDTHTYRLENPEPGVYSMTVYSCGCEKVFENVLTVV